MKTWGGVLKERDEIIFLWAPMIPSTLGWKGDRNPLNGFQWSKLGWLPQRVQVAVSLWWVSQSKPRLASSSQQQSAALPFSPNLPENAVCIAQVE